MTEPLVSIIIPMYNSEPFIVETINSAFNQTYKNIEIIIIDDGSTDNSLMVAKKLQSDKLKVFTQENKGPSAARNYGLKEAKGAYIQFLDADDWISTEKISTQVQHAIKNDFPDFIYSSWARVTEASSIENITFLKVFAPSIEHPAPIKLVQANNFLPLMSGLLKKKSIEAVGNFNEEMFLLEDTHLTIRMTVAGASLSFCSSDEPFFFYRTGIPNSQSSKNFNYNRCLLINYRLVFEYIYNNYARQEDSFRLQTEVYPIAWNIFLNSLHQKDTNATQEIISLLEKNKTIHFHDKRNFKITFARLIGFKSFAYIASIYLKIREFFIPRN